MKRIFLGCEPVVYEEFIGFKNNDHPTVLVKAIFKNVRTHGQVSDLLEIPISKKDHEKMKRLHGRGLL